MSIALPESVKVWSQFFHPILMWVLFALTLYAFYLGMQSRRIRSVDAEVRKQLIQGKFGLRHHLLGAILLSTMVLGTLGGMAVTYINNGKLFLGPHLLVGLAMTGLMATSASLTPFMQKGSDWARYFHITLNIALVGLFGWQAVTGMQITQRIVDRILGNG